MSLPRSYLCKIADPSASVILYGFHDASTRALAAVVYLFLKTKNLQCDQLCCCKDESCTLTRSKNPSIGTVICLPSLKTNCFRAQESTVSEGTSRHKILHWISSRSILDLWQLYPLFRTKWRKCDATYTPTFGIIAQGLLILLTCLQGDLL